MLQRNSITGASPELAAALWDAAVYGRTAAMAKSIFLPFPSALKQCQTRLKAAKNQ